MRAAGNNNADNT